MVDQVGILLSLTSLTVSDLLDRHSKTTDDNTSGLEVCLSPPDCITKLLRRIATIGALFAGK